VAVRKLGERQF
jgi:thioredoxin reductase (NADPH)